MSDFIPPYKTGLMRRKFIVNAGEAKDTLANEWRNVNLGISRLKRGDPFFVLSQRLYGDLEFKVIVYVGSRGTSPLYAEAHLIRPHFGIEKRSTIETVEIEEDYKMADALGFFYGDWLLVDPLTDEEIVVELKDWSGDRGRVISTLQCQNCGNDLIERMRWQEYVPAERCIAFEDGVLQIDGDSEEFQNESAVCQSLICLECMVETEIPEDFELEHV